MKNKNKKYYGLFYKSHGDWTGPYLNYRAPKSSITNLYYEVKRLLRSKAQIKRVSKK